jgi:hypothetical protein
MEAASSFICSLALLQLVLCMPWGRRLTLLLLLLLCLLLGRPIATKWSAFCCCCCCIQLLWAWLLMLLTVRLLLLLRMSKPSCFLQGTAR